MGLEVISNIGATYREIPKEVITTKVDAAGHMEMMNAAATQHISQAETKAVNHTDESSKYYEEEKQAEKYQNNNQRLKKAIEKANKNTKKTHCEFNYHEETNRFSISIKDDETGDVIKEIPAEETLDMLSKMWEIAGLFIDDKR